MNAQNEEQTIEPLTHQVDEIIFGTLFSLVGLAAAGIAVIRHGKNIRILIGLALWSGLYGVRLLILSAAIRMSLPQWFQPYIPYIDVAISYLILVFALLAWLDLTRKVLHLYIRTMIFVALAIAIAGIGWFIIRGTADTFLLYNSLAAAATLLILVVIVTVRKLSDKLLVLPNRGILAVGTLIFAGEALYSNLADLFGYQTWPILGWLGFAVLLFSLAFVAAKMIFASERRLIAIENELETARKIQTSILPNAVPELDKLSIVAAYQPMAAVAGDLYDFIPIDSKHAGFLVADVSGHGVPAALIASMVKIAMQSVADSAHDPGEVMRRLSSILANQMRGQFVTAAYLYVDSATGQARYSAAGHPPLLYWDSAARQLESIESNGLFFGYLRKKDYPVREITFQSGDRFLLYTDGLIEARNADSEAFGDRRLLEIIRAQEKAPAEALNAKLLEELQLWQPASAPQQDDLTWIIIDIK
jgi:sigma-B regulation protein RsbU (phosphoserine phosphatase)